MNLFVAALLKAAGIVGGFTLLAYAFYRAVRAAKKSGGTGSAELLATVLLTLGIGIAPAPPREVKIELKRDEDESGDPPCPPPTEPAEPALREPGMKHGTLVALALSALTLTPAAVVKPQDSDAPAWQRVRDVPHGVVQRIEYQSTSIEKLRQAIVYLPPGYDGGTDHYPVLYLLHGAGGDESVWTQRMQVNVILDNLIADGELDPLVVVMPHGFTNRMPNDERPRAADAYKPEMEEFAIDFLGDLVPHVESRYRVVADRAHRAIAGNSMGGGQALRLGLTHPRLFSSVASFSAAMQIANDPAWGGIDLNGALANADAINELDLLWIGCGTEDGLFNVNKRFSDQLTKAGIEHTFRSTAGAHTPDVWSRYLHELAPQLF